MKADQEMMRRVSNIGRVVARSVVEWMGLEEHRQLVRRLLSEVSVLPPPKITGGQLAGKSVLIFGVANRKSVAWHIGRVLSEADAKCVYVVRSDELASRYAMNLRVIDVDGADVVVPVRS